MILLTLTVLLTYISFMIAYQTGDRVSAQIRSQQSGYSNYFHDIPIDQMPRFRICSSSIINVKLPRSEELGHNIKLDTNEDFKVSLSFSNNKVILPWLKLFDSNEKKSLQKLIITFNHDEFDVLRLTTDTICK